MIGSSAPHAVVVGLCAHGLDLVRALTERGIRVTAIESRRDLAGVRTALARVVMVDDVNGDGFIPSLLRLAQDFAPGERPALILTNDRMVFLIAEGWDALAAHYTLSWADHRHLVGALLLKDLLEAHCVKTGVSYPRTQVIKGAADLEAPDALIKFPAIVKPIRPLSSFKAELVGSLAEARAMVKRYPDDLPFLFQQWIPGDDRQIVFSAIYFRDGKPLAHYEGQKLGTLPRGLGVTTVAAPLDAADVFEQSLKFFAPYRLTGPVSLEFKRAPDGKLYVIEPTMFRTDFWYGLCASNGVDIAYVECIDALGLTPRVEPVRSPRIWADFERDPMGTLKLVSAEVGWLRMFARVDFTYLSRRDPMPACAILYRILAYGIRRAFTRRPAAHSQLD